MSAPWRANKELNDKIYRIKMRGLVMRLRAEQRELEEREFRSWLMWERYMMDVRLAEMRAFKEEDHPRKPAGTSGGGQFVSKSGGQGLTKQKQEEYNKLITDISDEEERTVKGMVFRDFSNYSRKDIVQICPYQFDYIYYAKILNDKGDCDVIGKKLPPKRARKK